MGLFDLVSDVATDISANIEYIFAEKASDETMAYTYLNMSMDDVDKDTLNILKDVLGYGDDAYICMAHMDNVTFMTMAHVDPDTIAAIQGISKEMVLRILQMGIEYSDYKRSGKMPLVTKHDPIGGVLSKAVAMARYCKETYNKNAVNEAIKKASLTTSQQQPAAISITPVSDGDDNVLFTNATSTINTMSDAIAAAER